MEYVSIAGNWVEKIKHEYNLKKAEEAKVKAEAEAEMNKEGVISSEGAEEEMPEDGNGETAAEETAAEETAAEDILNDENAENPDGPA